ncbi:hypothetical protein JWG45_04140 [Leptospira sp. 201903070]|uniref:Uncharacterized protein n=1 Tax=Leptospira ainlahdjerensis TaxID=2810033 RepID=A0ABS2U9Y3_9LEPT|nr:hypothetical protein [Leptospira ainlahdjerensis]MBM9576338.1 hypothetical protein [Leptospira ainlahdjerensis]
MNSLKYLRLVVLSVFLKFLTVPTCKASFAECTAQVGVPTAFSVKSPALSRYIFIYKPTQSDEKQSELRQSSVKVAGPTLILGGGAGGGKISEILLYHKILILQVEIPV